MRGVQRVFGGIELVEHGSDQLTDQAIALREPIDGFLRQHATDGSNANTADTGLLQIAAAAPPTAPPLPAESVPGYAPSPGAAASPSAIPPLHLSV